MHSIREIENYPPMMSCPKCGAEQEDFDGFGVLYCAECSYCVHPSVSDDVCCICGKAVEAQDAST